jgi:hypothetical protein
LILGAMLLGLAVLARRWRIGPRSNQTVLSQIMGMAVGRHWAYYVVSLTITVVLALAANTSFGGLPILASLLARDNYLPHLFGLRGDRQVFDSGIWVLAVLSGVLLVAVGGNTNEMIPLFAIGVFTGFTLSQTGLVVHWWRTRPARWRRRAAINGGGAVVTALATLIFLISKFAQGAWIVVIAVPAFVLLFLRIHSYYDKVALELSVGTVPAAPVGKSTLVIVPVHTMSQLTRFAISEALSLSPEVIAISVLTDQAEGEHDLGNDLERQWAQWHPGPPLQILRTEYSSIVEPICAFIEDARDEGDRQIVVLIPIVVPSQWRYRLLHNQLDLVLSTALRKHPDVIVARVQMPLDALSR